MDKNLYYMNKAVLFEMVKYMKNREVVFLDPTSNTYVVRGVKAHKVDYLLKNFDAFKFTSRNYNIYYSVAILENMPMFSFNPQQRKQQRHLFNTTFSEYMSGYDFIIDFDLIDGNFGDLYHEVKHFKSILDEYQVVYSLRFSGTAFHISISHYLLPVMVDRLLFLRNIMTIFKETYNFQSIDTSIYDERRIIKVPYSYDVKTGNVCLPLTDEQFLNFDRGMVKAEHVLKSVKIRDRGDCERIGNPLALCKLINNEFKDIEGYKWENGQQKF